jgi:hypothetical protein
MKSEPLSPDLRDEPLQREFGGISMPIPPKLPIFRESFLIFLQIALSAQIDAGQVFLIF